MSDDHWNAPDRHAAGEPSRALPDSAPTDLTSEFAAGGEPSELPLEQQAIDRGGASTEAGQQSTASDRRRDEPRQPFSARDTSPTPFPHSGSGIAGAASAPLVRADDRTQISKRPPLDPASDGSQRGVASLQELEGTRLEHFELEKLVGGGGMGAVFRALDTRLNRYVAVKILAQDQACDDERVRRFRNEAQSAARLDHENVARVYYVGEDRGLHFIAFEYISGTNIRDMVSARGPLPAAEALTYAYQIGDALAHANSRDVVHRDIKPSNVIVTPEGRAKLVDMGLARLDADDRSSADLTASGVTLGTFDYISPEQALDPRDADVRSDIYSLGCTLYFMLTGQPPFPLGTPLQKLLHHHSEKPPDPRELNRGVPEELAGMVQRMMAKDPARRPATPEALVFELQEIASGMGVSLPAVVHPLSRPVSSARTTLQRQLPWLVPVAALLLLVVVVDRLAIWPGSSPLPAVGPTPLALNDERLPDRDPRAANNPTRLPPREPAGVSASAPPNAGTVRPAGDAVSPGADDRPPSAAADSASKAPGIAPPVESPNGAVQQPIESNTAPRADVPSTVDPAATGGAATGIGGGQQGSDLEGRFEAFDGISVSASPFDPLEASAELVDTGIGTQPFPPVAPATSQPAAPAVATGLRIVDPSRSGPMVYSTLRAACAAAQDGDVIELRYDGIGDERPWESRGRRLTLRAAEGHRPIVRFRPTEVDPLKHPRQMIKVASGRLTMVNLAFELDLSLVMPAEGWSLFELQQAELVRFERCSLTIRNTSERGGPQHADVAFVIMNPPPGAVSMEMMSDPLPPIAAVIELQNCVARGDATFLRVDDLQPVSLVWENGFLATNQRLLAADGGSKEPQHAGRIHVDLRHLTAAVRDGLCLLTDSVDAPYQLPTEVRCADSILVVGPQGALIEQAGIDTVADFRARFKWESDRNFYEGFSVFWKIRGQSTLSSVEEMTLSPWNAFWGGRERSWGRVVWREPPDLSRPPHLQTPDDFALSDRIADNPARRGASDGRDAGCDASLLPAFPNRPAGEELPEQGRSPSQSAEFPARSAPPQFR